MWIDDKSNSYVCRNYSVVSNFCFDRNSIYWKNTLLKKLLWSINRKMCHSLALCSFNFLRVVKSLSVTFYMRTEKEKKKFMQKFNSLVSPSYSLASTWEKKVKAIEKSFFIKKYETIQTFWDDYFLFLPPKDSCKKYIFLLLNQELNFMRITALVKIKFSSLHESSCVNV